jgi:ribosomal protein S27AE
MSEGYLFLDHRASPGIPEAMARATGLPPGQVREGKVLEMKTKACRHCGAVFMLNPDRTRARHTCPKCAGNYICDGCAAAATQPQYVHRSFDEIADLVRSGRFTVSGDPSAPILLPTT